jgi:hypothetical protein
LETRIDELEIAEIKVINADLRRLQVITGESLSGFQGVA